MKRVVAYVPDLMDRSKLASSGAEVSFVARPQDLAEAAAGARVELVVVDLGRPGVLEVIPALVSRGAKVIGFGSHVDAQTLEEAAAAGCAAMPRSRFFRSLGDLVAG